MNYLRLSIDGQKTILEYLKTNIYNDYHLIKWNYYPNYKQVLYILNLCFNNLVKPTETGGGISAKKLAHLIKICDSLNNLYAICTGLFQEIIHYFYLYLKMIICHQEQVC